MSDYINGIEAAKLLGLSPEKFVVVLQGNRESLPASIDYAALKKNYDALGKPECEYEDVLISLQKRMRYFYTKELGDPASILFLLKVHKRDLEDYQKAIIPTQLSSKTQEDKHLNSKTKNCYLLLIAALLHSQNFNPSDRNTVSSLQRKVDALGQERTLGKDFLKKVCDEIQEVMA
ncbi:MAG: hypothetical protein IJU65_07225 [Desulfovibrio sp.]|nr:hypothetical protein [Desulfovibrio sp.]